MTALSPITHQNPANLITNSLFGSDHNHILQFIIDKITLVCHYDAHLFDQIMDRASLEICSADDTETKPCYGYKAAFKFFIPGFPEGKDQPFGHLFLGRVDKSTKTVSIRLEWNPAKAGEAGTSHLYQRLNAIAPFGIQDFLNRAQVNRVDAALDLSGVKVDDLLLCAPNQKCGAMYINAAGSADTIYFGSRKSKVYRRLYSKKCGDLRFTRLELELKQAGSLGLLGEASNPFKDVTLHQIPDEASGMTRLFWDSAQKRGLARSLRLLDKPQRQQMEAAVQAAKLPWWDPDKYWALWPTAVEQAVVAPAAGVQL